MVLTHTRTATRMCACSCPRAHSHFHIHPLVVCITLHRFSTQKLERVSVGIFKRQQLRSPFNQNKSELVLSAVT